MRFVLSLGTYKQKYKNQDFIIINQSVNENGFKSLNFQHFK